MTAEQRLVVIFAHPDDESFGFGGVLSAAADAGWETTYVVGTRGEVPTVASPMYKQVFDLRTGRCLDAVGRDPIDLTAYPVRVCDGAVLVGRDPRPADRAP